MSKSNKFTPGPWSAGHYDGDEPAVVTKHQTICLLEQSYFDRPLAEDEVEANAHLIAAAPELLEALQLILKDFDGDWKHYEQAKRAVAKALGESHE